MSDYKSLFKHSGNYLLASLASKALSFVSIPVYTRLLSLEDYGIVNVFMSLVSIVAVFLTLSSEVSISRYYYDAKDTMDFKRFVGTSVRITSIILVITTVLFILGLNFIADMVCLPKRLTLCLVPVALFYITNSIFTQIYNPQMQSRKIAIVSSVQSYSAFAISIVCILLIDEERYYGYIYGNLIAMILLGGYIIHQIKPFYTNCFDKQYVPYILKYCLPYIPDALSGIVLAQFSKIFIGSNLGYSMAGSYGFVVNVALLMGIVIQITNNAWTPFLFRYLNDRDYKSINNDWNLIWRSTLVVAIGLSLFGNELAILLAKEDFLELMYLLPILVTGYVFHQLAYLYLRNVSYSKKMIWNTFAYVVSGFTLVVLNFFLVPKLHGLGAAVATVTSYIILVSFAYCVNKYVIKVFAPSLIQTMKPFLFYVSFIALSVYLYSLELHWGVLLFIKIVIFIFGVILFIYPYADKLKLNLNKIQ